MDRDEQAVRVGVLGGTFDPLHVAHLEIAHAAIERFSLARVLFVPTGAPWQKERYSPPEDRFLMTALGTAGDERFAVSRMEIDREGPTYTADTMEHLRHFYGESVELMFIAGADAVRGLGSWIGLDRLALLAEIIAVDRPGIDLTGFRRQKGWPRIHRLEMPGIGISSTDIRAKVAAGEPIDDLVPPAVHRYITERGLYLEVAGV